MFHLLGARDKPKVFDVNSLPIHVLHPFKLTNYGRAQVEPNSIDPLLEIWSCVLSAFPDCSVWTQAEFERHFLSMMLSITIHIGFSSSGSGLSLVIPCLPKTTNHATGHAVYTRSASQRFPSLPQRTVPLIQNAFELGAERGGLWECGHWTARTRCLCLSHIQTFHGVFTWDVYSEFGV